jgi:uncharacterized repeat protein (TIGR03803 family)
MTRISFLAVLLCSIPLGLFGQQPRLPIRRPYKPILGPAQTQQPQSETATAGDTATQLGAQQRPSYKVLYTFSGGTDGGFPTGLAGDGKGNFYGITNLGGNLACPLNPGVGCGTVFKMNANGTETVPWAFTGGADGDCISCNNGVLPDDKGNLYGVSVGGTYGWGLVFKLDPSDHLNVLYNFTGGADGGTCCSSSTPILDSEGNLYGTTDTGGDLTACGGCGVVFKLDPSGNETVLHAFTGGTDGAFPNSRSGQG